MVCLDSAVKESLRVSGLNAIRSSRRVTHPSLTLPDGTPVPRGANIGLPLLAIPLDDDICPEAEIYDPFRFVPSTHSPLPSGVELNEKQEAQANENQSPLTSTSETYLAFGHGRRPCVGRFIFQYIMKIIAAQGLMGYEIRREEKRPGIKWFGRFQLQARSATVMIRRRKGTEVAV